MIGAEFNSPKDTIVPPAFHQHSNSLWRSRIRYDESRDEQEESSQSNHHDFHLEQHQPFQSTIREFVDVSSFSSHSKDSVEIFPVLRNMSKSLSSSSYNALFEESLCIEEEEKSDLGDGNDDDCRDQQEEHGSRFHRQLQQQTEEEQGQTSAPNKEKRDLYDIFNKESPKIDKNNSNLTLSSLLHATTSLKRANPIYDSDSEEPEFPIRNSPHQHHNQVVKRRRSGKISTNATPLYWTQRFLAE